jgi:hypothetical protein
MDAKSCCRSAEAASLVACSLEHAACFCDLQVLGLIIAVVHQKAIAAEHTRYYLGCNLAS